MSPRIRSRRANPVRRTPAAKGVGQKRPAYRYVSPGEAAVIRASQPSRVPNLDLSGKPKFVYFTWDLYKKVARAESALRIGACHPAGPFSSPSDRVRIELAGITYTYLGIVPGETGTELRTPDSPLVLTITALIP